MNTYRRVIGYLRPYGKWIGLSMVFSLFNSVFSAVSIYLTLPLLETLFAGTPGAGPAPAAGAGTSMLPGWAAEARDGISRSFREFIMGGEPQEALLAGFAYNTFPLMGGHWVPDGAWQLTPRWINLVENPATVQFVHRALAWTLAVFGIWLWHTLRVHGVRRRGNLLLVALALQFALGILTILRLPSQPVLWGATHQAGAVALLIATVLALHAVSRDRLSPSHS